MSTNVILQKIILEEVEKIIHQTGQKTSSVLPLILNISKHATLRRMRLETNLTLEDLFNLKKHFGISIDTVLNDEESKIYFDYQPMVKKDFCLENYLNQLLKNMQTLYEQEHPEMTITINNTPFFTLFNFPNLLKAKLFFWAKNQIAVPELKDESLETFYFSSEILKKTNELLQLYLKIPTKEIYDPDILRGFVREIYFHHISKEINDENTIQLYDEMIELVNHLKNQAEHGLKYEYGKKMESKDEKKIEIYYNEVLNSTAIFHYKTKTSEGLFMTQNFLNPVHITDKTYVQETNKVLINMIRSSSKISTSNSKTRNSYFDEIDKMIQKYKRKVIMEREFSEN